MTRPLHSSTPFTRHECSGYCEAVAPGHRLQSIQERVASATPAKWADGIVTAVSGSGWISVALLADDSVARIWNHEDLTEVLEVGSPVALHAVYDVLATGSSKYNVFRDA